MSNRPVIELLSSRLAKGLIHPGDQKQKLITLPGLSSTGIPPEMAKHFAEQAGFPTSDAPQLIAEAIIHLLETDCQLELVPKTEMAQLRAEAATLDDINPTAPTVAVHCTCNRKEPLLTLAMGRPMVTVKGKALRQRLDEVCTCPT